MTASNNIFFFLLYSSCIIAQQRNSLTGQFVDETGKPIVYLEVVVMQNDTLKTAEITDEKGMFRFQLAAGTYNLLANHFGTNVYKQEIQLSTPLDLGQLPIDKSIQLGEVIITNEKKLFERKVDRLVFNVENTVVTTGGNALDALRITPRVRVHNDKISMVGKGGLTVMISDRVIQLSGEDLANYLRSLNADDIKKIEVITNPPSKYEADGSSGFINIIFKKNKSDSWSNSIRSAFIQTTFQAYSIGNTFNFDKKKVSFSASLNLKTGNEATVLKSSIFYPNEEWFGRSESKNKKDFFSNRVFIGYRWNENTSLGIQYIGNFNKPDVNDVDNTNIFSDGSSLKSFFISKGDNKVYNNNNSLNIHFIKKLDTIGKKVSVDLDYFDYKENQNRFFSSKHFLANNSLISITTSNNVSQQNIDNFSVKIDFEHPTKWANLSYGSKLFFTNSNNVIDNIGLNDANKFSQGDAFDYIENTQSLYLDLHKVLSKKWSIKTGLRVENTNTKGFSKTLNETNNNNYTKYFPSFYLLHTINDNNVISLNYGRRIKRPSYWELNPFRWELNSNSYTIGNPFLQPSFSNNLEITHSYKQKLFSTLFSTITNGDFSQIPIIDNDTQKVVYQRLNYFDSYVYGLAETYIFNKFSWLQSYFQFTLYFTDININKNVEITPFKGVTSNFSSNSSITLNKKKSLNGEINASYNFSKKAFIYEFEPTFSIDLGLKYSLGKEIQASFSVNDIFKTSVSDVTIYSNNIKQTYNAYYDNRYFKISLKYSFGNDQIKTKERVIGNSKEIERIKKE